MARNYWRKALLSVALLALAIRPVEAFAATPATTFSVTATVLASCTVSAGTLAFGSYTPTGGSPADATSTIDVTCTNGTPYTVALDGGSTENNVAARAMNDPSSHTLSYGIYKDSARTTIWGDGTGSTVTQSGTGIGSLQGLTAYGRVPASQFVAAGNYSDTVTVTVSY
jgi:spore coat protein U-like protein